MKTDTITIEDMSYSHCEITVQDAIRKLPGIKKAKASKRKKQATITYNEEQASLEQIMDAVLETGYQASM